MAEATRPRQADRQVTATTRPARSPRTRYEVAATRGRFATRAGLCRGSAVTHGEAAVHQHCGAVPFAYGVVPFDRARVILGSAAGSGSRALARQERMSRTTV